MGFNTTKVRNTRETYEGGKAYPLGPEHELYLTVVSSLLSGDSYYETQDARTERLQTLVRAVILQGDAKFVAGLAAYTREQMHLRTTPTVLTAELFLRGQEELGARAAERVWVRGDEHLEALAYCKMTGAKLQKSLLRAVAKRLNSMNEYSFTKYAAGSKSFSQRDAIRVAHPVPKDEKQSALFNYMVHGWDKLSAEERALLPHIAGLKEGGTQSWEQHISKEGSTQEAWTEAVDKMGYMALLRNLRNLVEKNVAPEKLKEIAAKLSDPEEVEKSKQLPFRFLSAARALPYNAPPVILNAISRAADSSVANVPDLEGTTLVLSDISGSMDSPVSGKSKITCKDAAAMLAAILAHRGNAEVWAFGTDARRVMIPIATPVLAGAGMIVEAGRGLGYGTNIGKALTESLSNRVDRVIVLTDMQAHDHANDPARTWLAMDKKRRLYVIDLQHYGKPSFDPRHPQIMMVGGFSDKVFDWLRAVEATDPLRTIRDYME